MFKESGGEQHEAHEQPNYQFNEETRVNNDYFNEFSNFYQYLQIIENSKKKNRPLGSLEESLMNYRVKRYEERFPDDTNERVDREKVAALNALADAYNTMAEEGSFSKERALEIFNQANALIRNDGVVYTL